MKAKQTLTLLCLFITHLIHAQCNITIPASNQSNVPLLIVEHDTVINIDPNTYAQDFLVCSGATLTYQGNESVDNRYFVESGGTVLLKAYHYPLVYLKGGATLDAGASLGASAPSIIAIYYEATSTLLDTAGLYQGIFNSCNNVAFDYSLLPGGVGCVGATGIEHHLNASNMEVYPNPTSSQFKVSAPDLEGALHVINAQGKLVDRIPMTSGAQTMQIDVANYPNGIYMLNWMKEGTLQTSQKVIVSR